MIYIKDINVFFFVFRHSSGHVVAPSSSAPLCVFSFQEEKQDTRRTQRKKKKKKKSGGTTEDRALLTFVSMATPCVRFVSFLLFLGGVYFG